MNKKYHQIADLSEIMRRPIKNKKNREPLSGMMSYKIWKALGGEDLEGADKGGGYVFFGNHEPYYGTLKDE